MYRVQTGGLVLLLGQLTENFKCNQADARYKRQLNLAKTGRQSGAAIFAARLVVQKLVKQAGLTGLYVAGAAVVGWWRKLAHVAGIGVGWIVRIVHDTRRWRDWNRNLWVIRPSRWLTKYLIRINSNWI